MSRRLIQEKEIAPTSFQMTAEKAPHPASGRHQGAFPAAGPKKPGQSWTPFPVLANVSLEWSPVPDEIS